MNSKDYEFRKKLLETFQVEAEEHVTAMVSGLVELEKTRKPEKRSAVIERAFREAHSLKGAARAVNLAETEALCQILESKFASLKRGELPLSPELFDELHRKLDALTAQLASGGLKGERKESVFGPAAPSASLPEVGRNAEGRVRALEETASAPQRSSAVDKSWGGGTVRITTSKLDTLFLQAEELLSAKLAAQRRAADLKETSTALVRWRRKRAELRPLLYGATSKGEIAHLEYGSGKAKAQVERFLQYFQWEDSIANSLESNLAAQVRAAEQDARFLAGKVDGLVEDVKRVLMLPFASILDLFPKLVRDLSREQGKEIDLIIQGGEVEADKRILEEMKDPLVHLLRNAVDHGIEKPPVRAAKKKASRGRVTLVIAPKDAGRIEVLIADDGAGIEFEQVRAAAVKQGIVPKSEADKLDEEATLSLIFRSGVSTNPILTDISGRGLGLAIVREKVEELGGSVLVETHHDAGTVFRMILPVTLATSRGILVRVGEQSFLVPTLGVERAARAGGEDIRTVENRETIEFGGRAVAFVRLEDVLELPRKPAAADGNGKHPLLVLSTHGTRVAFRVDEILGEQEVLVKSPPKPLSQIRNMAGATVLGTGAVVPILNIADLVNSASRAGGVSVGREIAEAAPSKQKSILVAEDSITARSLLKGILESAGYKVRTAVNGADAFATMKTEAFDLVVSDVDMPRMSGFDLTAKVRADKHLAQLPVVLVTALESREDRERGIDVGADAYIVKSSFDQSNLLEIIRRLI
jgi:two-component system, chemotaxis family, sensor kinase CheA